MGEREEKSFVWSQGHRGDFWIKFSLSNPGVIFFLGGWGAENINASIPLSKGGSQFWNDL